MTDPVVVTSDERVAVPGGADLATDVFRLAEGPPRPVLLVRTPYGRASLRQGLDPVALVRRGWAVVLQDIRGRWDSGGAYRPWHQDVDDGAAVVAWCREQEWCDGSVVMQGASYDGVTAWLAASTLPPGLAAISPVVSSAAVHDPMITTNGTLNLGFLANWGLGHVTGGNTGTTPDVAARAATLLADWPATVGRDDVVELIESCFPPSRDWFERWRRGERTEAVAVLGATPLRRSGLPAYHVTGWYDSFVEGALRAYAALRDTPAAASQRLVVGPWSHGGVFATSCGDLDFPPAASGWDRFPGEQLAFLRTAAAGERPAGGATVWVVGDETWVELEHWPPPTAPRRLFATAGGGRTGWGDAPSAAAGRLTWRHDPSTPVPTVGGRTLHPGAAYAPGPRDRAALGARDDVVTIVSAPLGEDWTVMGEPELEATLTSETAEVDLHVHLLDVHPDGRAVGLVGQAHRLHVDPGRRSRVRVGLGTIAARLAAGHRLGVQIASSDWPAHDVTRAPGERWIDVGGEHQLVLHVPAWDGSAGRLLSP